MPVPSAASVPYLHSLRRLRLEAALSQKLLAERASVSQTTVSDLETRKQQARPSTMRKLADALGVEPRELFSNDGQR